MKHTQLELTFEKQGPKDARGTANTGSGPCRRWLASFRRTALDLARRSPRPHPPAEQTVFLDRLSQRPARQPEPDEACERQLCA